MSLRFESFILMPKAESTGFSLMGFSSISVITFTVINWPLMSWVKSRSIARKFLTEIVRVAAATEHRLGMYLIAPSITSQWS